MEQAVAPTAAPAAEAPAKADDEPLNPLVDKLRAIVSPENKRLCLFYVCDKCTRDKCDWWHPAPEARAFTPEEVEATLDFCGRPRDYTKGRKKGFGKRSSAHRMPGGHQRLLLPAAAVAPKEPRARQPSVLVPGRPPPMPLLVLPQISVSRPKHGAVAAMLPLSVVRNEPQMRALELMTLSCQRLLTSAL